MWGMPKVFMTEKKRELPSSRSQPSKKKDPHIKDTILKRLKWIHIAVKASLYKYGAINFGIIAPYTVMTKDFSIPYDRRKANNCPFVPSTNWFSKVSRDHKSPHVSLKISDLYCFRQCGRRLHKSTKHFFRNKITKKERWKREGCATKWETLRG